MGCKSPIRPLARSVDAGPRGIRGSAPHHGIELLRSDKASGLADPGCPVSPSLHHHPRNPVRSPLAQAAAATLSFALTGRVMDSDVTPRLFKVIDGVCEHVH